MKLEQIRGTQYVGPNHELVMITGSMDDPVWFVQYVGGSQDMSQNDAYRFYLHVRAGCTPWSFRLEYANVDPATCPTGLTPVEPTDEYRAKVDEALAKIASFNRG